MRYVWQSVRALVACFLVTIVEVPPSLVAQSHVVSPADLQKEMVTSTQARQHSLETVTQFLSSPRAENALKSAHMTWPVLFGELGIPVPEIEPSPVLLL